ncbi:MAG: hypothetical protein MUF84_13975 [Anaerolineae bacterium]|nr:hypothetical protein [Anaerolineae bacterium]
MPHAAVACNPGPGNDFDGVVGVLALLLTHRVPVDLSALYDDQDPMALPLELGDLVAWDEGEEALSDRTQESVGAEFWLDAHSRALAPHQLQVVRMHLAFLAQRGEAQARASRLIRLQASVGTRPSESVRTGRPGVETRVLSGARRGSPTGAYEQARMNQRKAPVAALAFDEEALREFAVGDVERCFGPDFAVYRGRRLPRIPNGDLMMMSRIVSIDGRPGIYTERPSLVAEYDVPEDAWYYGHAPYTPIPAGRGLPPVTVLMETGLQPCGFLSAYLRSPLLAPEADLYFRNLEGRGRVLAELDLRGRTVSNRVVLNSSVRGPGAILQSYTFALDCQGQRFYEGEATFGYFHRESLSRQVGLDAAPTVTDGPRFRAADRGRKDCLGVRIPARPGAAARRLHLLHDLVATRGGDTTSQEGPGGLGIVKGSAPISPMDWFFAAHFHQDAVMPGSLGVEAAVQALVAYGRWRWPHLAGVAHHLTDHTTTWRYRGQITPEDSRLSVDVRLTEVREDQAAVTLVADASVWRESIDGGVRIYEITGLATRLGTPWCRSKEG